MANHIKKPLTDKQIAHLNAYFLHYEAKVNPVYLITEVLLRTGCRLDEACRVKLGDISTASGEIRIMHGSKNGDARFKPVPKDLCERLHKLHRKHKLQTSDPFIKALSENSLEACKRQVQRFFRNFMLQFYPEDAGAVSLHSLRHTYITRVYEAFESNIVLAAKAAGHKSITSTMNYVGNINLKDHEEKLRTITSVVGR